MLRVLRSLDWSGFGAIDVSRVIEFLWALLSRLLSDDNHPFPPFGRAGVWPWSRMATSIFERW